MREIKFRAWEKNLKEIIQVDDINFKTKMINTRHLWRNFDEIELMQYTGIKDKNGVEIYEGDILKVYDDFFRVGLDDEQGVIVFENGRFRLNTFKKHNNESWVYFKVIGNIHQKQIKSK